MEFATSSQLNAPSPRAGPAWDSARPDPRASNAPFRTFNIGASSPVQLTDYIGAIEAAVG